MIVDDRICFVRREIRVGKENYEYNNETINEWDLNWNWLYNVCLNVKIVELYNTHHKNVIATKI